MPTFRGWRLVPMLVVCVLAPQMAHAWNYTGHRIIASIAYRELDDATRKRVADVLRHHPAYQELWVGRASNGPNEGVNLFWNASTFPDDARRGAWAKYNRPKAHYVNYRIMADEGNKVEPPVEGENVVNSYVGHVRTIRDVKTSGEDRALHLSWVFHQAGDIHMPLHAVARISKAIPGPEGDRGGNGVGFPSSPGSSRGGSRGSNLHAYWDGLLGTTDDPAAVEEAATRLRADFPRAAFGAQIGVADIGEWAKESVELCLTTVYRDLDPTLTRFADAPVAYEADAVKAARRRGALAGYRLADELKRLFPGG